MKGRYNIKIDHNQEPAPVWAQVIFWVVVVGCAIYYWWQK